MLNLPKLRFRLAAVALLAVALCPLPAHATSKEIIELQTQVQQLLDMVQRMQSTLDTRLGVVQHLAEQTADNANRISATVSTLQQKINAQNEAGNSKLDTLSGQVQSLNDSVDELKSRIAKLDKTVQDMQAQLQTVQNPPPGTAPVTPGGAPATLAPGAVAPPDATSGAPAAVPVPVAPAANAAPPVQETFQAGLRDYNAARYEVAASEFQDVIHYYPLDELAGSAQFYLGDIAYRKLKFSEAVKDFNAVLEGFPGSPKAPAAQLRKGLALLQMKDKRDAGVHELRLLIQRHPQSPEAAQARTKLNALGIKITPPPAPAH